MGGQFYIVLLWDVPLSWDNEQNYWEKLLCSGMSRDIITTWLAKEWQNKSKIVKKPYFFDFVLFFPFKSYPVRWQDVKLLSRPIPWQDFELFLLKPRFLLLIQSWWQDRPRLSICHKSIWLAQPDKQSGLVIQFSFNIQLWKTFVWDSVTWVQLFSKRLTTKVWIDVEEYVVYSANQLMAKSSNG